MGYLLSENNKCTISHCNGKTRRISKLLKILLMKGENPCRDLFRVLKEDLKREELILKMKDRHAEKIRRGNICFKIKRFLISDEITSSKTLFR